MSVGSATSGGNSVWDSVREKATEAKNWAADTRVGKAAGKVASKIGDKFNAAVNDVKTTDSKLMKIIKAVAYSLVAVALVGFLVAIAAPIAYFCTPALIGVFVGALAIASTLAIGMGIKAAVLAVAAHRQGKAEDTLAAEANSADSANSTDPANPTTADAGVAQTGDANAAQAPAGPTATPLGVVASATTTEIDAAEEAGKTITSQASGKIATFFKKHWKALLTVALVVLVVAMCLASGGIGASFLLIAVTLAGAYGVLKGVEHAGGKAAAWLEDKKAVSEEVEKKLNEFKETDAYKNASPEEKKVLEKQKKIEFEEIARNEVAEKRAHANQIEEIKSRHGVDDAEAETIFEAQKAHDTFLQKQIDDINDEAGLDINLADVEKQLKKDGRGGDYHVRLKKALDANNGNLAAAKKQLRDEDTAALNGIKGKHEEKRNAEMPKIKAQYGLDGIEPPERGNFIAKQLITEKRRQQKWTIQQNAKIARARGGVGVWRTGVIGRNFAGETIREGKNDPNWDHLTEYQNALIAKLGTGNDTELDGATTKNIRDGLRQEYEKLIKADNEARVRGDVHKEWCNEMVDGINLEYGVNIGHSAARKEIEIKKGPYQARWKEALAGATGDNEAQKIVNAQKTIADEDRATLVELAETTQSKTITQEKIEQIKQSYELANVKIGNQSPNNGQQEEFAKEILKEINIQKMWVKQRAKNTDKKEAEIEKAIAPDPPKTHAQVFKEKVAERMGANPPPAFDDAAKQVRKALQDANAQKVKDKFSPPSQPGPPPGP
ncbi:MAG: hypothetical protein LBF26_01350 [Puniceicoccales bacterium]|jgi:hypothetical protein|nr:hypothetical protein [Puniceicoccales bacterium]